MKKVWFLIVLALGYSISFSQARRKITPIFRQYNHYNVDSLINEFRKSTDLNTILNVGTDFYKDIGLTENSISKNAFILGFLAKSLNDQHKIFINNKPQSPRQYNSLLVIIDFTKIADQKRMVIVDLSTKKLLFHTYVAHGRGKYYDNPVNENPRFFSNVTSSNMSSLGFMVTEGPTDTVHNPCHYCRFNLTEPMHKEQLLVDGLEKKFNDNAIGRAILFHTTGSKNLDDATRKKLGIKNQYYHVDEKTGRCYFNKGASSTIYASKEYIDSTGYIGRSDGCFVIPEVEHQAITKTIFSGTLIFCYSDVIIDLKTYQYNYFNGSPVINAIQKLAQN